MHLISQFISDEIIYALGWTMVHSLWQGFLIAMVLALVINYYQNENAKLKYELSAFALFTVFTSALATFLVLYDKAVSTDLSEIIIIGQATFTFEESESVISTISNSSASLLNQYLPLLVSIWFVGMVFFLIRLLGGLIYIQHLKTNQLYAIEKRWQIKMEKILKKTPINKSVKLFESGLVKVPIVIGYLKPLILMPIGAINNMSEQEVEAILSHEIAHVLRNDYILNIVMSFIEVLFYFHPAVWWISDNVKKERENCCDDLAIQLCGDSMTYAKALVRIQEMQLKGPRLAMGFSGNKNQLLNRIKRILNQPGSKSNINEKATAVVMLFMAVVMLSFSTKSNLKDSFSKIDAKTNIVNITPDPSIEREVIVIPSTKIITDTIPKKKKKRKQSYVKTTDEGSISLQIEDDIITRLKINGKVIPESDYQDYENEIASFRDEMDNMPSPPAPPSPPSPPAVIGINPPAVPDFAPVPPPAPPAGMPAPPAPPAPPLPGHIINRQEGNGNTMIIRQNDNVHVVELGNGKTIVIHSNDLQVGDSIVVFENGFGVNDPLSVWPQDLAMGNANNFKKPKHTLRFQSDDNSFWVSKEEDKKTLKFWKEKSEKQERELLKDIEKRKEKMDEEIRVRVAENNIQIERIKKELEEQTEKINSSFSESNLFPFQQQEKEENKLYQKVTKELIKDKLIEKGDRYRIKMTNKHVYLNGKKLSSELSKKYSIIIENYGEMKLGKNSTIEIENF